MRVGRHPSYRERLGRLAADLTPRRPPTYISQPDRRHSAPGWWWTPQGLDQPVYLGHNHITAETNLRQLLDAGFRQ